MAEIGADGVIHRDADDRGQAGGPAGGAAWPAAAWLARRPAALASGPAGALASGPTGTSLDGAAVVVTTSGTTGRPKGVVLSAAALDASARAWISVLPPATGWLLALGLGHVAGLGVVWRAIIAGVPIRVVDGTDPDGILAALEASPGRGSSPAPSHVSLVPTQLTRLLDRARSGPPDTLLAVPLGGGRVPPELVLRALDAGWPVVPTYGLSEAGSGVTALPTAEAHEAPESAGRPLPGVQVTIDEPDADGIGEIIVATSAGFSGYLGEAPRERQGPIRTGDLGRLDAVGRLVVVDRRTDRIVRGGENIAPAEVEAVLETHPAIAEAAVVARPDPVEGQVPVAAVVIEPGKRHPGFTALAAHARASVAGFKVPTSVVRVPALPRTSGGKLRRSEVRAMLERPVAGSVRRPDGTRIGWRSTIAGPRAIVLLHGTLSSAAQLDRLAAALVAPGDVSVLAIDRRGSGGSRIQDPAAIDVATHVDDLLAALDHHGLGAVDIVGLSYGGVVALETAARQPERVRTVVAWEPPYGPLADTPTRDRFAALAVSTAAPIELEVPRPRPRRSCERSRAMPRGTGFRIAGGRTWRSRGTGRSRTPACWVSIRWASVRITAPVMLLTGSSSEPFYAPIARAAAGRIPGARLVELDGLGHAAPLTEPARVAAAIRDQLELRP